MTSTSYLILLPFLPEEAHEPLSNWLRDKPIQYKITAKRHSKLGDFRPAHKGKPDRISLNGDMNPYLFLLTLVHELAHFESWDKRLRPHGHEWKEAYKKLLNELVQQSIFPDPLNNMIHAHMASPPASCGLDIELSRALKSYDLKTTIDTVYLEDIPIGSLFEINGNRIFKKGERLRKRYRCVEISNKRVYLFQPGTEVSEVSPA